MNASRGFYDDAVSAAEAVLNSRAVQVLEIIDPTTFLDLMIQVQTGYSIWDTEEDRFDKCVAAGKCT